MSVPSSCSNCKLLERVVGDLKSQLIEVEDRRSKERVRFVTETQKHFFKTIDGQDTSGSFVSREMFEDLLDLVTDLVENRDSVETLNRLKVQLDQFRID